MPHAPGPRVVILVFLAILSGCAAPAAPGTAPAAYSDPTKPNADIPAPGTLSATFIPGGEDEVIVVRSFDRQAIHSATLVEPDGRTTEAFAIDQSADPSVTGLSGLPFASDTPTVSPVPSLFAPPPLGSITQTDTFIGQTLSAASIRLPDRALYNRNWQQNRLRVVIGMSAGDQRTIIMAAPRPPGP